MIATPDFQNYDSITDNSSVYNVGSDLNSTNHIVSIIGWGLDYWIIANSWSDSWGNHGFAKVKKSILKLGQDAMFCNILTE
jgi:hypothetical protein